jgi:wyosine [tRNA(Phe)-imidazoG37] synthetase (radical SAM superfamily)
MSIVFGPIPSRRLGRSLGINNIPHKVCDYSCIYCQLGSTNYMSIKRREFFTPNYIYSEVVKKVNQLQNAGEKIDYITFVPEGEPTFDINLGKTVEKLKELKIKIAVITNSSLIWVREIQNDLMKADLVSVKIDSVFENIWKKINRPHGILKLKKIIQGIEEFASRFSGKLITETMMVKGINDSIESIYKTAEFIKQIKPEKAFILVPTRPPTELWVKSPDLNLLAAAFQIFYSIIGNAELLTETEGTKFSFSSDVENELLSILTVHPMHIRAVEEFLSKSNSNWSLVKSLIDKNILQATDYSGSTYLLINK